jgi:hypothetical protein
VANVEGALRRRVELHVRYELGLFDQLLYRVALAEPIGDIGAAARRRLEAITAFEAAPTFDQLIRWRAAA